MWRKARWLAIPAFLAAVLFVAPDESWGQPPGGFGRGGFGKGGRGMDPDVMWNFMARGADSINLNDPQHARTKRMMESRGQAIPPNGILTKDQYRANYQQMMAQGGMSGRSGGDRSSRPSGPPPAAPTVMTFTSGPDGKPVMISGTPGAAKPFVTMSGTGPDGRPMMMSQPGGPSMPGSGPNPDMFNGLFKRADRNGDGRVTPDESDDRIRREWPQYDRNGDGSLDQGEYTAYWQQRFSRGRESRDRDRDDDDRDRDRDRDNRGYDPNNPQQWNQQGGWNGQQGPWNQQGGQWGSNTTQRAEEEIQRPVVYRYGKLPKEVPGWFEKLDTDKDGMVGLYEWRRDTETKRQIKDFTEMDLNQDSYLTASEWLRHSKMAIEKRSEGRSSDGEEARPARTETPRGGPPRGGRGGPGASERSSRPGSNGKDNDRGPSRGGEQRKPNPFTGGR